MAWSQRDVESLLVEQNSILLVCASKVRLLKLHRRTDEADINTPTAVDQRVANCLEKAVWTFTTMRIRCMSSRFDVTFLRRPQVFRVVQCSSVYGF
ncbi:hypothetical protein TNCV_2915571 [Trichonephila clavipes]|nr:hypothetical protein TNCV_2915571 [Trichonephila clavipes]